MSSFDYAILPSAVDLTGGPYTVCYPIFSLSAHDCISVGEVIISIFFVVDPVRGGGPLVSEVSLQL